MMREKALEPRVARLEGAFEQIADRMNGMDHRLETIEQKIDVQVGALRAESNQKSAELRADLGGFRAETAEKLTDLRRDFDKKFLWMAGLSVTSWVTIMAAIALKH